MAPEEVISILGFDVCRKVDMMKKVRVAIAGIGGAGTALADVILQGRICGAELCAVCDRKQATEAFVQQSGSAIPCFEDYETMIDSGGCDAVIIATPHRLHPKQALRALKKGIHVFSEKPAGIECASVYQAVQLAEEKNLVYGINFNRRILPLYVKLHKLVTAGEIGKIRRINWTSTNWLRNQSYLEYPNGATGVFIASTGEYPGTNRIEIAAEHGRIVVEDKRLTFDHVSTSLDDFIDKAPLGFKTPEVFRNQITTQAEPNIIAGVLQNFIAAVRGEEELLVTASEGIKSLTLANAILLSSWQDNWVNLPLNHETFLTHLNHRIQNSTLKKSVNYTKLDLAESLMI
jgi:predicted dehydrogenase